MLFVLFLANAKEQARQNVLLMKKAMVERRYREKQGKDNMKKYAS